MKKKVFAVIQSYKNIFRESTNVALGIIHTDTLITHEIFILFVHISTRHANILAYSRRQRYTS